MYLSDKDIRSRLPELNIDCKDPSHPFSEDEQIQPCSIDLRLSKIFWEPIKSSPIDLRKRALLVMQPRRYYKRTVLRADEYITLKPGRMLIASTYEKFSVPTNLAAKIEGRSSFGRLGLSVHCTGDFANPGYRGNFPLILTNNSPTPIRLFPYIPICQLMLVPLSTPPERQYGDSVLQSKYMDDDGGPSYWWRDKRIEALQQALTAGNIDLIIQEEFLNRIGIQEPEVIERFEKFIQNPTNNELGGAQQVLRSFAESENKLRSRNRNGKGALIALFTITASIAGGSFLIETYGPFHYAIWTLTIAIVYPFIKAITVPESTFYGIKEHEAFEQRDN